MGLGGFFGLLGNIFGGGGDKKNKNDPLTSQLQPLIDLQKQFAQYGFPASESNFGKAGGAYNTALDFYKKILTGSDDEIMKLINANEFTKSTDESQALAYNLGGRSGTRTASLANSSFDRSAILQKILSQIRSGAPGEIANIGQGFANMAGAQAGAATGTSQGASNIIFGLKQIQQQEADRRAALISSLISAAGSAAGAFAASDIQLKENVKPISEIVAKLRKVHGFSFDWNLRSLALGKNPGDKAAGLLANQVYQVFPEFVEIGSDGYKRINYMAMTALLNEVNKDLDRENTILKKSIRTARGN